jgi:hypothetical protein
MPATVLIELSVCVSLLYVIDTGSTGDANNCMRATPPAPTPAVSPHTRGP